MRPEQNIYLVDGAQNMNRMDGGYAVKIPVDAIAEFRILTQSAPPEYGGTGGATTSVVTRGGSNQLHGSAYEFVRNDAFDARNFFSSEVEPLDQHQFGATVGRPAARQPRVLLRLLRGIPQQQGVTTSATVPTAQERQGDFSGMSEAAAQPGRGRRAASRATRFRRPPSIRWRATSSICIRSATSRRRSTARPWSASNDYDQAGAASTSTRRPRTSCSRRYSYSGGHNINPISVRGTDVPGYPTRDDLATHTAAGLEPRESWAPR